MEHYVKQDPSPPVPEFIPRSIIIQHGGKIKNYVQAAQKLLEHGPVTIQATGLAINKAVTVCELVKRNAGVSTSIELFADKQKDEWVPKNPNLDKIIVTRSLPGIRIVVNKS